MTTTHETLAGLIRSIRSHDPLEEEQIASTLAWIKTGAPLYRLAKEDDPPMHLVAYFLLYDSSQQRLLLVDHKKAGLWLPSGGHVEPNEHPQTTVQREVLEELGIEAAFLLSEPLFLTVTPTVGSSARHTDVSLWYVLKGDSSQEMWFDEGEFHQVAWFALDALPLERCDPHLARFAIKLQSQTP
jgi:8-oxo-dGTP diphosphatase